MKNIPVNIVMTYPVRWSKYKVLRDFVQNFYDSVPRERWKDAFAYMYTPNVLRMSVKDVVFSYEWLLHIGASTKTASRNSAGFFGEGFKIASLCAVRDYQWQVSMSSGDWKLKVILIQHAIDTSMVSMLAYAVDRQPHNQESVLELSGLNDYDYSIFRDVLNSFYYPENPLFGEKYWDAPDCAIYGRSKYAISGLLPITNEYGTKGAVFCNYQMLGTNPFNLVVCYHAYKQHDRERKNLYTFDVIHIFNKIAHAIDSRTAMIVLEEMRKYWNTALKKKYDCNSWSNTIDNLVIIISNNDSVKQMFTQKYQNLLFLPKLHSLEDKNRRLQARSWLKQQETKYILVKNSFLLLGYRSLEDECERKGGFVNDDNVKNDLENACFALLEELTVILFKDFFNINGSMPKRKVIRNITASYSGMALITKKSSRESSAYGTTIRYTISSIYLKYYLLSKEAFHTAVSTYIHEFCHIFGSDASESFSHALTDAMSILLRNQPLVEAYHTKWRALFDSHKPEAAHTA